MYETDGPVKGSDTPPLQPEPAPLGAFQLHDLARQGILAAARAAVQECRIVVTRRLQENEPPPSVETDLDLIGRRAYEPLVRVLCALEPPQGAVELGAFVARAILYEMLRGDLDGYRATLGQRPPQPAPDPERR